MLIVRLSAVGNRNQFWIANFFFFKEDICWMNTGAPHGIHEVVEL